MKQNVYNWSLSDACLCPHLAICTVVCLSFQHKYSLPRKPTADCPKFANGSRSCISDIWRNITIKTSSFRVALRWINPGFVSFCQTSKWRNPSPCSADNLRCRRETFSSKKQFPRSASLIPFVLHLSTFDRPTIEAERSALELAMHVALFVAVPASSEISDLKLFWLYAMCACTY